MLYKKGISCDLTCVITTCIEQILNEIESEVGEPDYKVSAEYWRQQFMKVGNILFPETDPTIYEVLEEVKKLKSPQPIRGEEKPDEEIVFWMSEDELYYTIGLQNEARTVTIPIHTFPLHSNDIPIKIKVTSKEALSAEFTAKYPDWDKFL